VEHELLDLTRQLLDAINRNDWKAYEELSDPTMTGIESVALGQILEGLEFHRANFTIKPLAKNKVTTIVSPHVRVMGDVGIVSYARVNRHATETSLSFYGTLETRVFHRQAGKWKQVHFHQSDLPPLA
jgi:calcium/calmodulin-dependent protein kinase (CaM kinase) II